MKRIAIVGAGAVGLYYGARLALNGEDVSFLLRSDYEAVEEQGIRLESVHGDAVLKPVKAFRTAEEIGPVDLIIVAWKATANDLFESVLPPLCHEETQLLTLQNGLGNCERLAEIVGPERVMGGLCFVCLNRLSEGFVKHTAGGKVTIGDWLAPPAGSKAEELVRRFKSANIPAEFSDDLKTAQWRKLVWNTPFNGLSIAEGGVTTDRLLADPETKSEIRAVMGDVIRAARALGCEIDPAVVDFEIDRTKGMDAYRPSSMIDYVEGREVEFDAIWAEPLRQAKLAGADVPHMEALASRIQERLRERR
ncbi:2-dehydropantoate 2-reductase [Haloferula chungangensis]|uniref:2-dehydropantoate 2-reductase n=1 Tax=Haloferula chungangensis TaxID=1048331 RepID=A0ABW2L4I7_9BACT